MSTIMLVAAPDRDAAATLLALLSVVSFSRFGDAVLVHYAFGSRDANFYDL